MTGPDEHACQFGWNQRNLAALIALCVLAGVALAAAALSRPMTIGRQIPIDRQRAAAVTERIDPNTATVASLRRLPGIGPTIAQRIVDYRTAHPPGPFRTANDLTKVERIGERTVQNILPELDLTDRAD